MNKPGNIFLGVLFIMASFLLLQACEEDCEDCLRPRMDPFVNVSFFNATGGASVRVNFSTFNGLPSSEVSAIRDTLLATYRFPLNMNDSSSTYILSSRKAGMADTLPDFQDTLILRYQLRPVQDLENIRIEASNIEVIYHSFDSVATVFNNQARISNETTLRIFY